MLNHVQIYYEISIFEAFINIIVKNVVIMYVYQFARFEYDRIIVVIVQQNAKEIEFEYNFSFKKTLINNYYQNISKFST